VAIPFSKSLSIPEVEYEISEPAKEIDFVLEIIKTTREEPSKYRIFDSGGGSLGSNTGS
jgi:hypothetical protein